MSASHLFAIMVLPFNLWSIREASICKSQMWNPQVGYDSGCSVLKLSFGKNNALPPDVTKKLFGQQEASIWPVVMAALCLCRGNGGRLLRVTWRLTVSDVSWHWAEVIGWLVEKQGWDCRFNGSVMQHLCCHTHHSSDSQENHRTLCVTGMHCFSAASCQWLRSHQRLLVYWWSALHHGFLSQFWCLKTSLLFIPSPLTS